MTSQKQISRARAVMNAARSSLKEGVPAQKAADDADVSRSSVTAARLILEFGSEDDIASVEFGKVGFRTLALKIHDTLTEEMRASLKRRAGLWTMDRREKLSGEAELWARFSPALRHLTELPKPADIVSVVKSNVMREAVVDQHISAALSWLTEFSNGWTKYKQNRNSSVDTRTGGDVAGTQHTEPATEPTACTTPRQSDS